MTTSENTKFNYEMSPTEAAAFEQYLRATDPGAIGWQGETPEQTGEAALLAKLREKEARKARRAETVADLKAGLRSGAIWTWRLWVTVASAVVLGGAFG